MNALLVGYDLIGFVDGTNTCPSPSYCDYSYWRSQDQLILHAIISSVDQVEFFVTVVILAALRVLVGSMVGLSHVSKNLLLYL